MKCPLHFTTSGPGGHGRVRAGGDLVRAVGLEAVHHGVQHGAPTAAGRLPVFPAVRRLRTHHHVLKHSVPRVVSNSGLCDSVTQLQRDP